jgi:hypothetical protein
VFDSAPAALDILPLTQGDLDVLVDGQEGATFLRQHVSHLINDYAWVARWNGRPVLASGFVFVPHFPGYAEAWAMVRDVPRRAWPKITIFAIAEIARAQAAGVNLIECTVDRAQPAALRWARKLGFEANGVRPGYAGRDCILFGISTGVR